MKYFAFSIFFALIMPFLISDAIAVPVERVPITSFGAYSPDGKEIQEIVAGTQANLVSNVTNTLDEKQSFVYGTWISENNGTRTPIDWIETSLDAKSSSVFSIPWIPDTAGKYAIEASIWENNETFTAFSAIWQVTLDVIAKDSHEKLVPEPESESQYNSTAYENCGSGTTLQDGICVVDRSHKSSSDSAVKWGSGIVFPRHGNPPDSFTPIQHERNGTPFDQMQCRNDEHVLVQKYDGSPACVKPETKEKLIDRGWTNSAVDISWKKHITVSAIRYDSYDLEEFLPAYKIKKISDDKLINQLLVGADGCKNETEVCKIPSGVSLDRQYSFLPPNVRFSDNYRFSISLDVQQAEYLLSVSDWKNVGDSFFSTVHQNEKRYFLVLSTFDDTKTPVVKMNLVGTSHEPVSLERGITLEYTIRVDTWATYGAPAQIDLLAVHNAKDSGIKVWVEPETMMIPERSNATSTLFIHASDNARDGIYDIRVMGKANGNNASLYCSNTICPTVNVGNSVWEIRTFGSDAGRGIGGGSTPENTWMELELNKDEFTDGDVAEISAYLVNNSTEPIEFTPRELLITVIKAQPVGYYDHLYGIDARYESDKTIVLEPKSTTLLVRPFYWNQTTFQSFDDEQRLDPKQYKMMSRFVGEGHTWYDDVWFEVK